MNACDRGYSKKKGFGTTFLSRYNKCCKLIFSDDEFEILGVRITCKSLSGLIVTAYRSPSIRGKSMAHLNERFFDRHGFYTLIC